jgi:hypothetical protein
MATPIYVRGSNPVWSFVDLQGNQFDDTFYMFVLENTLPYAPAMVWHDPFGNVVWTNPIQFLANGTLPIDIFWDPDMVYRLEFRQGPTQSDPLIYLVENYTPGGGGGGNPPIEELAIVTGNMITNPQFSLVSFSSPFTYSGSAPSDGIAVAPGWDLILAGSGTVVLTKVPLSSVDQVPTNAPYALRITLTGSWTGTPYLRQRFNQAGMLWANTRTPQPNSYVSGSITARVENIPVSLFTRLDASTGAPQAIIIPSSIINDQYDVYPGQNVMPVTTNTDIPPDAYIDYKIFFPNNSDIYLTSIQLVKSNFELPIQYPYEQETIERQVDHTFHYYRESILFQPKSSILTGWDFSLNPWQFTSTTSADLASNAYTADQSIIIQQAYVASATPNNIQVGRGTAAQNYGLKVTSKTATNQFAALQYIDPAICRPYWGGTLSSLVKVFVQKQSSVGDLRVKMKLLRSTGIPTTTNQTYPVSSWSALGEPSYNGAWSAVSAVNDPVYNLVAGENIITFDGFNLAAATNDNETLAIIFYTIDPMTSSGTPDFIILDSISLVPNEFAIASNPLTFEQTLKGCEYYYEKSYKTIDLPGTVTQQNAICAPMNPFALTGSNQITCVAQDFGHQYRTPKREFSSIPTLTFYSGTTINPNTAQAYIYHAAGGGQNDTLEIVFNDHFTAFGFNDSKGFSYRAILTDGSSPSRMVTCSYPGVATGSIAGASLLYHFTSDARMGV